MILLQSHVGRLLVPWTLNLLITNGFADGFVALTLTMLGNYFLPYLHRQLHFFLHFLCADHKDTKQHKGVKQ